jgi:hypothetical protein
VQLLEVSGAFPPLVIGMIDVDEETVSDLQQQT